MTRLILWTGAALLTILGPAAQATAEPASRQAAEQLVRETTDKVLTALKTEREALRHNPQRLYRLVDELILPHFDFSRMSRRVLGRHWRDASADQRNRFVSEFQTLLVRTYATALNEYKDQTIDFLPVRGRAGADEVSVRTQVNQSGGPPIPITYQMYRTDHDWKVYDVAIDGVSLVINYRSTFNTEIQRGGIDGLIARLVQKNQSNAKE